MHFTVNLLTFIHYAVSLYMMIVVVRALLSWVNPDPSNPVVVFLRRATDPALYFIRRTIPLPRTALDVSPLILLIGLMLVDTFILEILKNLALPLIVNITRSLLHSVVLALRSILTLYMYIIIIRALISWVNPDPYNFLVRAIYALTDPILYRVRRLLPVAAGGFDFSPFIVIILLYAVSNLLTSLLH